MKAMYFLIFFLAASAQAQSHQLGLEFNRVKSELKYRLMNGKERSEFKAKQRGDKTSLNLIVPLADRLSLQSALGYADVGQTVSGYYETSLRFLPRLTLFYFEGGSQNQGNSLFVQGGFELSRISFLGDSYQDYSGILGLGFRIFGTNATGLELGYRMQDTLATGGLDGRGGQQLEDSHKQSQEFSAGFFWSL